MLPLLILISALLPITVMGDATEIGCYSSLPSSFTKRSTYQYQSSSYCASQCSDYSYFALTEGNTCICGNDAPSGSTSDSCTTSCFGYGEQMCGGSDAYSVYSTGNESNDSSDSSSSSSTNADSSTSSSSTSTSKSSTTNSSTSSGGATTSTGTSSKTTSSETTAAVTTNSGGSTTTIMSTVAETASDSPTSTATKSSESSSTSSTASSSASESSKSDSKSKKTSVVGPVVGGVVGGVALVAIVSLVIFFLRRRNQTSRDAELADSAYYDAIKRDNSTVARPLSNPFLSKEDFTDQRLNPVMLGRRRISEGSLADEADYSRKILRVANPDDDL